MMKEIKEAYTERVTRLTEPTRIFSLTGTALIQLLDGSKGKIEMDSVDFESVEPLTEAVLMENLNEGGFGGCEILGAMISILQEVQITESIEGENPRVNCFVEDVLIQEDLIIGEWE